MHTYACACIHVLSWNCGTQLQPQQWREVDPWGFLAREACQLVRTKPCLKVGSVVVPCTQDTEADRLWVQIYRSSWSTERIPGWTRSHAETLSQNNDNNIKGRVTGEDARCQPLVSRNRLKHTCRGHRRAVRWTLNLIIIFPEYKLTWKLKKGKKMV